MKRKHVVFISICSLLVGMVAGSLMTIAIIDDKQDKKKYENMVQMEISEPEHETDEGAGLAVTETKTLVFSDRANQMLGLFGCSKEDVLVKLGAPKEFNASMGHWGWQMIYEDAHLESTGGDVNELAIVAISVGSLFEDNRQSYPLDEVMDAIGYTDKASYEIGTGQGDYSIGEGIHYIAETIGDCSIELTYDGDETVYATDRIIYWDIELMEHSLDEKSTVITESNEIEEEVSRIRKVYNEIVAACDSGEYTKKAVNDSVEAYYDVSGDVRRIIAKKGYGILGDYTQYYYYENGQAIFIYLEAEDSHRLYFCNETLFRWRYAENAANSGEAVNHDGKDAMDFPHTGYAKAEGDDLYFKACYQAE